jgi:translation initiation factor IF-3
VICISSEYRVNDEIRLARCRLISADGEQLGLFDFRDALRKADEEGYDLVEIAPQADPPVCKIMDFGKFKYEQSMKAKQARKHQQKIEIKEMKFRPKVDIHDYNTKKKHILRFLDAGAKVKVTIMFRGREMAHPELGLNILVRLADELEDLAVIENQPKLEGRNMHMLISPLKKKPAKDAKEETGKDEQDAKDEDA